MDAGGPHKSQRTERALIAHSELRSNPAAQRGPPQMNLIEAQSSEEVEVEGGKVADIVEPLRRLREAKAGVLRDDQFEVLGQAFHERKPAPCPPRSVQVEKRLTSAPAMHAHPTAGDPLYGLPNGGHVLLLAPAVEFCVRGGRARRRPGVLIHHAPPPSRKPRGKRPACRLGLLHR